MLTSTIFILMIRRPPSSTRTDTLCPDTTRSRSVYTTDPRIVARARKLDYVTYEEMLELASVGAKVLQTRSVGLAMKEGVRVQVLSSFVEGDEAPKQGTMIVSDEEIEEVQMERQLITGIAHDKNEAKFIVTRVPDRPGGVANIFGPLAAAGINVDMIIQNVGRDKGETDVTFTVPAADLIRDRKSTRLNSRHSCATRTYTLCPYTTLFRSR